MHNRIVIVGRPNVGKSTLYNRLTGRKTAIVHHKPGTTRDRNESTISWKGKKLHITDTAGWSEDSSIFSESVHKQLKLALDKADTVVFVVDGKNGIHPYDAVVNNILRKQNKKTVLAINKIDTQADELKAADFFRLGIEEQIPISANHGRNVEQLLTKLASFAGEETGQREPEQTPIRIILVGKPNVGKSSLTNVLSGEERSIVHDMPGTTIEALDISIKKDGKAFMLIDTPGLHRKKKFSNDMEYLASLSTHHALENADVAVLVMDATQGVGETEARIAEQILNNGLGCLLAVNKWDMVEEKEQAVKAFRQQIEQKLQFLSWARVVFLSAKTKQRTDRIFSEVEEVYSEYSKRIPHDKLVETIRRAEFRKPLSRRGQTLKIRSIEQSGTNPPTFSLGVNDPLLVHFSYKRFIENNLREDYGFLGTPLSIRFFKADK